MRKQKGIGVPTAIALCTVLLIASLSITTVILSINAANRVQNYKEANEIIFRLSLSEYLENENKDDISDDSFDWSVYITTPYKALLAERGGEVRFYAVIHEDKKILAYQSSSFYITEEIEGTETVYYLGGLVAYRRVSNS